MVYNTSRGTDACGIYINEESIKGVKTESDARTFLAMHPIEYVPGCKNKLVIAHTRKSLLGAAFEENAHPYTFTNDEGRSITLAHNGTINNIYDLARESGVDCTGLLVDSQKLAKIILEKGYSVLNDYKGTAALLFSFSDDPNALYVFKGASLDKVTDKEVSTERPLFYIETMEGCYFSSMWEPLDTLTDQVTDTFSVPNNKVFRVINNEFTELFTAERDSNNIYVPAVRTGPTYHGSASHYPNTSNSSEYVGEPRTEPATNLKSFTEVSTTMGHNFGKDMFRAGAVHYLGGRYYARIMGLVGQSAKDVMYPACPDSAAYLMRGYHSIMYCKKEPKVFIPQITNAANANINSETAGYSKLYFYEGVLISPKKVEHFIRKVEKRLDDMNNPFEKLRQLSSFSETPITYLHSETSKIKNNEIKFFIAGKPLKSRCEYRPILSHRKYSFDDKGNLIAISTSIKTDTIFKDLALNTSSAEASVPALINPATVIKNAAQTQATAQLAKLRANSALTVKRFEMLLDVAYYRLKGYSQAEESTRILAEEIDGAADTTYYNSENNAISFTGKDILIRAIMLSLLEILGTDNQISIDHCEARAAALFNTSNSSSQGLIHVMKHSGYGDFASFVDEAILELHHEAVSKFKKTPITLEQDDYSEFAEVGSY